MTTVPHPTRRLADVAWTELDGRAPVLLVPLGACEQHGPHLPMRTDTIIASTLADRAAGELRTLGLDALVAPPVEISASGEHQGFPGTLSIGTEAMTTVVVELARSADWSAGLVLVNGHGGNLDAVTAAAAIVAGEQRRMLPWWPSLPDDAGLRADLRSDLHAGHIETSVLLAIDPGLVRADPTSIEPVVADAADLARIRARGVLSVSPSGVLGDARHASATAGAALVDAWVDDLVLAVRRWAPQATDASGTTTRR